MQLSEPADPGARRAVGLRAEALDRFGRAATVITESPDKASHRAIRSVLTAQAAR
jgi:hypothetical protein